MLYGQLNWPLLLSGALAIEASIIHNFTWHYLVTWRDRVARTRIDYFYRLIRYNLVTASIDFVMKLGIIWGLTHYFHIHYLISDLISMLFGPIFKYAANEFIIFKHTPETQPFFSGRKLPALGRDTPKIRRINQSMTRRWEHGFLQSVAERMPPGINSDHMTTLAFLSSFVIASGYYLTTYSKWWLMLSSFGLVLHWFGDSMDGTLARVRNQQREKYGFFVDHLNDVWTIFIVAIGLGFSPLMDMRIAFFAALAYLIMNVYVHIIAFTNRVFILSFGKFGPTELRLLAIAVNTTAFFWNPVLLDMEDISFTAMDIGGLFLGTFLTLIFLMKSIQGALELNRRAEDNIVENS